MLCTVEESRGICLFPSGVQEYPTTDIDEVYHGIFIGNAVAAADLVRLHNLNIGYVLNAAYGLDACLKMVEVHPESVYTHAGITFLGIPAIDMMSYPISQHFDVTSVFISEGLSSGKNVLVHCVEGISRSATLVLAYLVQVVGMQLQEAIRTVRQRREILPNDGFLLQLCHLNENINKK